MHKYYPSAIITLTYKNECTYFDKMCSHPTVVLKLSSDSYFPLYEKLTHIIRSMFILRKRTLLKKCDPKFRLLLFIFCMQNIKHLKIKGLKVLKGRP